MIIFFDGEFRALMAGKKNQEMPTGATSILVPKRCLCLLHRMPRAWHPQMAVYLIPNCFQDDLIGVGIGIGVEASTL